MDCHNVSIRGLTFDSDPPNYAQGVVTAVRPDVSAFTAKFDTRFIPPDTSVPPFSAPGGSAGAKVAFWDPSLRRMLYAVNFLNSSTAFSQAEGAASFNVTLKHAQAAGGLTVGNLVTIFPRKGLTWHCQNCSSVVADNVTIHGGGNMGFLETGGAGGNHYRGISIVRKPSSPGLMALNADGFHSSDVGIGPTLEDSIISYTGDDFLNIHNKMKIVCRVLDDGNSSGTTTLALIDPGTSFLELRPADELHFFQLLPHLPHKANPFLGSSVVRSVAPADAALRKECHAAGEAMQQPPYSADLIGTVASSVARARVYVATFAGSLPAAVQRFSLVNFERRSGAHFAVRRNHFHDSCGSGGRIIGKSINGTLESNVAERFGGVHVYSEQVWLEGALGIRNVLLANNTIVDARVADPTHVDVLAGLVNVTCRNNTFVVAGHNTARASGC